MHMKEKRKTKDRRAHNLEQDQGHPRNRRYRPCRRLGNIAAEEIPLSTLDRHPVLWEMFRKLGYCEQ